MLPSLPPYLPSAQAQELEYENLLMHQRIVAVGPQKTVWHINKHAKGNAFPLNDQTMLARLQRRKDATMEVKRQIKAAAIIAANNDEEMRSRAAREVSPLSPPVSQRQPLTPCNAPAGLFRTPTGRGRERACGSGRGDPSL